MWGRRDTIAAADERGSSDMSEGEDEVVMLASRSRSSRGVQVSPEHLRSESTPPDTLDRDNDCRRLELHARARRGAGGSAGGGNVGGGGGKMAWRWPARRLDQRSSSSARERPPAAAGASACGSSPSRLLVQRRRRVTGAAAVPLPPPSAAVATAAAVPQVARVLKRGVFPLRDDRLPATSSPGQIADSPASIGAPSTPPVLALASASASASGSTPPWNNSKSQSQTPEHLVASMLLNLGGGSGAIEPASPAPSAASDNSPGWAERVGLTGGVAASRQAAGIPRLGDKSEGRSDWGARDSPRFLRPVLVLLMLSLLTIVGTMVAGRGMGIFGPPVHAAGGAQLQEAVVDDIFDHADKDHDGFIADEEIKYLVEGAGGTPLDDASEIKAGVESVKKQLDRNADHVLSRNDLTTYWKWLGTLLTVDEVANWVVHAAQLPQEVADAFVNNRVTGYDFPELMANQGALLEQDLGVTRSSFRKSLVRNMNWKFWGMGTEPTPPGNLRVVDVSCGVVRVEWDASDDTLNFPVHKFVVRRARLGREGERTGDWETVMDGRDRPFLDVGLTPGAAYRYSLQAWNAIGHSGAVEADIFVAAEGCAVRSSWWWPGGGGGGGGEGAEGVSIGGLIATVAVAAFSAVFLRMRGGEEQRRSNGTRSNGTRSNGTRARRRPDRLDAAVAGVATGSPVSSHGEGEGDTLQPAGASPMSACSNGGGPWSDREKSDRKRLSSASASMSSLLRPVANGHKERLKRVSSEGGPAAPLVAGATAGRPALSGNVRDVRDAGRGEGTNAAAVESMRREAARRFRRSTSREDKAVCRVCRREWRWFRSGKHTCCKCHEAFCDRKECGVTTHSFGACPVGGLCTCNRCLTEGSRGSFDR